MLCRPLVHGVDKDSAKRQREAIATFAKRAGYEIFAEFNDEAKWAWKLWSGGSIRCAA